MDYSSVGLKCGLEIHQQLSGRKLFSNKFSKLTKESPDSLIKRNLRSSSNERGISDTAALYETKKNLDYYYEIHNNNTSLIELDEEPPKLISESALSTAIAVSKLLNCTIIPNIQIMRKTVIDGSNTSGFQRTGVVGINGYIKTSKGNVSINSVIIEEDSARRISETKDSVTYRLDRLGIPLIEITTGPDMKSPDHVMEVAKKIGMILRSTNSILRGIGTIRQDVNISINKSSRVELKGVQDINSIHSIIDNEIKRQKTELEMNRKEVSHVRNIKPDLTSKYLRPMPGSARMYPETDLPIIKLSKKFIDSIELPELIEDKINRYRNLGLNEEISNKLANSNKSFLFDVINFEEDPTFIARTLLDTTKEVRRKLKIENFKFPDRVLIELFELLSENKITKNSISEILERFCRGEIISEIYQDYKPISDSELKKIISNIYNSKKDLNFGAIMGLVMKETSGKADGAKVAIFLKEILK
jgi:Glu-tRNA(Gln) amidotransferase subunit E-like FAD-binding protein